MKVTRILPKFLAKTYQEEDLRRAEISLEYHRDLVRILEERITEGCAELERLREKKWDAEYAVSLRRILVVINHGLRNNYVEYVLRL